MNQFKFEELAVACILRNISYCIVDDVFYTWSETRQRWIQQLLATQD